MHRPLLAIAFGIMTFCVSPTAGAQATRRVYRLAEMNSAAIAALDPARTMMILPLDPLEEHGPHLPIGADIFQTEGAMVRMAARLTDSLPGWTIVLLPTIPYGTEGANQIPDRPDIRGTFSLRATTLRSLLVDVGTAVADNGFRWLFVVYMHGAQSQAVAVNDACDFVRETRRIAMLNLAGMEWYMPDAPAVDALLHARLSNADFKRLGFDIHAGMRETSRMLVLRPDLISPDFRRLPDLTVHSFDDLVASGKRATFRGYWSAPSLADSAYGRALAEEDANQWSVLALRAVRGEDMTKVRRYPEGEPDDANHRSALRNVERQRALSARFDKWIARRQTIVR